MGATHSQ